jgi:hypothetical protein
MHAARTRACSLEALRLASLTAVAAAATGDGAGRWRNALMLAPKAGAGPVASAVVVRMKDERGAQDRRLLLPSAAARPAAERVVDPQHVDNSMADNQGLRPAVGDCKRVKHGGAGRRPPLPASPRTQRYVLHVSSTPPDYCAACRACSAKHSPPRA